MFPLRNNLIFPYPISNIWDPPMINKPTKIFKKIREMVCLVEILEEVGKEDGSRWIVGQYSKY